MNYYLSPSELIKRSKVTAKPSIAPISLDDLKAQIRRTDPSYVADDTLLQLYIDGATETAQEYTSRKFIDQEITLLLDRWPLIGINEPWFSGTRLASQYPVYQSRNQQDRSIEIPWAPSISITEISTFDDDNNETVYDASNYFLDNSDNDMFSRVVLNLNAETPTNLRANNAVQIVYRVGYGLTKDDVPADIRVGISMIGSYLYLNRGDCNDCSCVAASGGKSFLDSKIIYEVN